jgi:hypothetical protein
LEIDEDWDNVFLHIKKKTRELLEDKIEIDNNNNKISYNGFDPQIFLLSFWISILYIIDV